MNPQHKKCLEYIRSAGGSPKIEWFDEDWEPIGPLLRSDMIEANLVREQNGRILELWGWEQDAGQHALAQYNHDC